MRKLLIGIAAILVVLFILDMTVLKDEGMINKVSQGDTYDKVDNKDAVPVGVHAGERAPDFTVNDLDGNPVSLSDFEGKKIMLNFWASWCGPCRLEMPHMERIYQESDKEDVVIIGVNLLTTEKSIENVYNFIEDYHLTFPIPLDEDGRLSVDYEILAYPTTYFIDSDRVIRNKTVGTMTEEYMLKQIGKLQ